MPLTLLAGPANAGKVALLLDRYLADIGREPVLIVPNRADIDRVERDLLDLTGALLGGQIGTFDDVFEGIARSNGHHRPLVTDAQRALLVRDVVARVRLSQLGRSARFAGFADALGAAVSELESGLVDPDGIAGELGELLRAYREDLDRLGLWDRDLERRHAAELVAGDLAAWDGRPVYAYGFEDLTGAQWALLEALAGRADVTVSLPYEPGRAVFSSLERTASDLARLADGRIEELPPGYHRYAHPALAHLERALFSDETVAAEERSDGAVRFLEAAGARGAVEVVADEILALIRAGTSPDAIAVVCPSLERFRTALDTGFGALGVPYAVEGRVRLGQTAFGYALLSLLRYAWLGGGRAELYVFMRSPFSGLRRDHVDFLEGRLRGRAIHTPERVAEETLKLRGQGLPFLDALRSAPSVLDGVRALAGAMLGSAYGHDSPPADEAARLDLRAHEAVLRLLDELAGWQELGRPVGVEDVVAVLERTQVRLASAAEPGRVAVLDLLRARTRRYEVVFLLGLEEGSLPRRAESPRLLDDDTRRELESSTRSRLPRPEPVARERYLFYTACTRPTRRLYLVREAATEDGSLRQPSPFWDDVRSLYDRQDVARWTIRRPLSALVRPLGDAPSERERLRAAAALASTDTAGARDLARAYGWERRLDRALGAFRRSTALTHPLVLEELAARSTFSVTELESFSECSSIWLLERLVDPRTIDGEVDARLRGSVAHQTLYRFFSGLPKQLKTERVEVERLDESLSFLRECFQEALTGHVYGRLELTDVQRHELEQSLWRDLEQFIRLEAESELPLVPRRFEVLFGGERAAPELRRGLELGGFALTGKIDRIDVDPFSARGIVQDYKSGVSAHSAQQIDSELKLQIPLYMLVLRDLVGIEPLGGLYRALAGERKARGLLRADAKEDGLPGFSARDYLDDESFWGVVERAQGHARGVVERIRAGDVRHDPKSGGPCPTWCQLSSMCRVGRA
jgi:ATP-dependent helicase/nuclease subunit B